MKIYERGRLTCEEVCIPIIGAYVGYERPSLDVMR
jgi:hypothetical protein